MESGLKSISKLFTERLLRIPDYQRGYSWKDKQLKEFWSDVEQLEIDRQHYLGVLTLEPIPPTVTKSWTDDDWLISLKRFVPYHVVDGQQRLTTIVIALQCILERMKADDRLNYNSRDEIQAKYIFVQKEGSDGSFLFGYERDNPSYEFLKTKILQRHSSRYSTGESTIYTKNLLTAKNFFHEQISKFKLSELQDLFTKITQNLLFNVFNIEKEVDVHVAFETMNNRGLQLSNLELLKNRLIYLTTRLPEQQSNISSLRRTINDSWKTVYHYLGKNAKVTLSDDYFLIIHFLIYFSKELLTSHPKLFEGSLHNAHDLYKRFLLDDTFTLRRLQSSNAVERIGSTALYKYSIDLKTTVEAYYRVCFPQDSDLSSEEKLWLSRLGRLQSSSHSVEVIVFLLLLLRTKQTATERTENLETIERYFFVRSVFPYRSRKKVWTLDLGHELLRCAAQQTTPNELVKMVREQLKVIVSDASHSESVLEGLSERGIYEWGDLKYFLYEYECHLKVKAKRKSDKIDWTLFSADSEDDHSSMEHILPQSPSDQYWKDRLKGLTSTQVKRLTNSLGNFVATSGPRNSSLRNRAFPEKAHSADRKTSYKFGSYSEIEVSTYPEWGPQQILERGGLLIDFLVERWGLKLPNADLKRKKLLGLDFL